MTDLISREKAINTAHSMRKVCDTDNIDDYHDLIVAALKDLPPSDAVEVRHGTWIEDRYNNLDYVCSECGEPCADMVMGKPRDRYCKWCGARMDGET